MKVGDFSPSPDAPARQLIAEDEAMIMSTRTLAARPTPRVRRAAVAAAALGVLTLSACNVSASANLTASPEKVATDAEDALEERIGQRPEIDCGDKQVDLVDGTVVECELTDPSTGSRFDTTVTLSDVDGTSFHIDVQVAQEPKG